MDNNGYQIDFYFFNHATVSFDVALLQQIGVSRKDTLSQMDTSFVLIDLVTFRLRKEKKLSR